MPGTWSGAVVRTGMASRSLLLPSPRSLGCNSRPTIRRISAVAAGELAGREHDFAAGVPARDTLQRFPCPAQRKHRLDRDPELALPDQPVERLQPLTVDVGDEGVGGDIALQRRRRTDDEDR